MLGDLARLLTEGNLLFLGRAALTTILLTAVGAGIGLVVGFALAYVRRSRGWATLPLRVVALAYVEVFRRIPFLVTLFLVLYIARAVVPNASLFAVASFAVVLLSSAYLAEIWRAGLDAVPRQQVEAAAVMNFSRWRTTRTIILPQAWPVILPPAIAYVVMFVKDTALASQIGVFELMFAGRALANRGHDSLVVFSVILLLYIAISWPLSALGRRLERRLSPSSRTTPRRLL